MSKKCPSAFLSFEVNYGFAKRAWRDKRVVDGTRTRNNQNHNLGLYH